MAAAARLWQAAAMTLDTPTIARRLKSAGFTDTQAEAPAAVTHDVFAARAARKDDVGALARDVARTRPDLRAELAQASADLHLEIDRFRTETAAALAAMVTSLTIRFGAMLAVAVVAVVAAAALLRMR